MKLSYYLSGTKILIHITAANKQEAEGKLWHFYNHKATDAKELNDIDNFDNHYTGYFWSNVNKLKAGLTSINLFRLLNNSERFKGRKEGVLPLAKKMAEMEFDSYERLKNNPSILSHTSSSFYGMGTIKAENSDNYSDDRE